MQQDADQRRALRVADLLHKELAIVEHARHRRTPDDDAILAAILELASERKRGMSARGIEQRDG